MQNLSVFVDVSGRFGGDRPETDEILTVCGIAVPTSDVEEIRNQFFDRKKWSESGKNEREDISNLIASLSDKEIAIVVLQINTKSSEFSQYFRDANNEIERLEKEGDERASAFKNIPSFVNEFVKAMILGGGSYVIPRYLQTVYGGGEVVNSDSKYPVIVEFVFDQDIQNQDAQYILKTSIERLSKGRLTELGFAPEFEARLTHEDEEPLLFNSRSHSRSVPER